MVSKRVHKQIQITVFYFLFFKKQRNRECPNQQQQQQEGSSRQEVADTTQPMIYNPTNVSPLALIHALNTLPL